MHKRCPLVIASYRYVIRNRVVRCKDGIAAESDARPKAVCCSVEDNVKVFSLLTALVVPSVSVSLWCRSNQTVCKEKHNNSSSNMSIYKTNDSNYYYNLKHTLAAHNERIFWTCCRDRHRRRTCILQIKIGNEEESERITERSRHERCKHGRQKSPILLNITGKKIDVKAFRGVVVSSFKKLLTF